MRIKIDGKIYIQNFDVEYIFEEINIFPEEILRKIPRSQDYGDFPGQRNRYQFDYFFEENDTINWLENQCWLIDETEWSEKSDKQIQKFIKNTKKEIKKDFRKMFEKEKYLNKKDVEFFLMSVRIQNHIIFSLETLLKNRKIRIYSPPKNTQ